LKQAAFDPRRVDWYRLHFNSFDYRKRKARSHRDLATVVGHAATISAGEWVTASGDWANDRTHGQQFRAQFLKTSEPTSVVLSSCGLDTADDFAMP